MAGPRKESAVTEAAPVAARAVASADFEKSMVVVVL